MTVTSLTTAPRQRPLPDEDLVAYAHTHGTPLYVYDLDQLSTRVAELTAALDISGARLFFATMANDRMMVLRTLARLGVGACVNSIPHLNLAQAAGFAANATQFTSTGVSPSDLETLAARRIRTNLDSLAQLEAWFSLGQREAGLRINAASLRGETVGDRIGMDVTHVERAVEVAACRGAQIRGLHVYVGTNFQTPQEMLPTLARFFDLAATVGDLTYVNIGGGIGVDYSHTGPDFDVFGYGIRIAELAARLQARLGRPIEVICEPGRAITASAATMVTAVTDLKELGRRRLAAVDASVAIFPRPLLHPESPHTIRQLAANPAPDGGLLTLLVGRTTYSRDILGSTLLSRDLEPGHLLAFADAGAYCQSMTSRFLGQPEPYEVYLGGS